MKPLILIIFWAFTLRTLHSQNMETHDLTDNEGYIPIKEDNINIIDHYNRIFYQTVPDTMKSNFKSLNRKLDNLTPHFRNRRGLIDGLGKGIKFITGNMDSEDEVEIRAALTNLTYNTDKNSLEINSVIQVSETLSLQIQNITEHINKQQNIVGKYEV